MSQVAKWLDPVLGIDIHIVLVPAPPAPLPIPIPMPHPFIGIVFDPIGALIGAGLGLVLGGGGPVLINRLLPVGNTGTQVVAIPHFPMPPGVSFAPFDIPGNEGVIVTGSKTVTMAGASAGRFMSLVMSCNFPINLPTSLCLAIAVGPPVVVGGPDSFDIMAAITQAIRTKWVSDKLHALLKAKPGSWRSKIICFLTGHPVDVMTGQVLTDAVDFELPGPIPLRFERNYYSRSQYDGPLGPGWHHPLDASVHEDEGGVTVRLPDGRPDRHPRLQVGESLWAGEDRYTLERTKEGYRLTFWDGRTLHFGRVPRARQTHPLVRVSDRCENEIVLRYEGGLLAEVVDSAGRLLQFSSTPEGKLAAIRLVKIERDLVRYVYDADGHLAAVLDPKSRPFRYEYRGGVLVKETNRNGLSFYFEYDWYDPEGYCVHTWGDGGIYDHRITYDKNRHVTLVDDSRGGRTHYFGNPAGLVDREIDPTGRERRHEWDQHFRKVAEVDGLGNRTEWAYDERGNKVLERDALGQETRWRYNELNVQVERIDAAGNVWRIEYDARGKPVRAIDALGSVRTLKHDRRGNLVSIEDPLGRRLAARYTEASDLEEVKDWEGHATRYAANARGSLVRRVDARGGTTEIERDECDRPVVLRRPDGTAIRLGYDGEGNVTERADALGNVTRYRYGGFNKLVERTDPEGGVVKYAYDTEENLIAVTNENGETYRIDHDLAGRVIKEVGFDGRTLSFSYDRAGRCVETMNAQQRSTRIERDALGRIVKQHIPQKSEAVEYAYDPAGWLVRAKNEACEVIFVRDALGRVIEERAGGYAIQSRYDAVGNRIGRRTSLGHEGVYDFDGNGDLLGLTLRQSERFGDFASAALAAGGPVRAPWRAMWTRDAEGGEVERRLPGGVASRWERDKAGLPRAHRVARGDEQLLGTGYQWRSEEQLAVLIDTQAGPTRFEHDARSYLVSATEPDGRVIYRAPDVVGNVYRSLKHKDRAYGAGGRMKEVDGVLYVHDADGRLVEKVLPNEQRWRYEWDSTDHLTEVTRPDGQKVTFAYDAIGRRVKKTFAGQTTTYVWSGNDLVHEIKQHAPLVTWEFEAGTFAPVAKTEGEQRYGIVTDHLGTPRMMLDEAGQIAWKAQLDLYGVARADVMRTSCPWRWPGQYEDEETGLYYNRFRYYDPEAGAYLSQDPIRLIGGLRSYGYVDDPLSGIDPLGLAKKCYKKSGPELEQDIENELNKQGIPILRQNDPVVDAAGVRLGEIDFEVPQAIIEATVSPKDKLSQITKYINNPSLFNPSGKPIILFAPNYGHTAARDIEGVGALVVRDFADLIALVR